MSIFNAEQVQHAIDTLIGPCEFTYVYHDEDIQGKVIVMAHDTENRYEWEIEFNHDEEDILEVARIGECP